MPEFPFPDDPTRYRIDGRIYRVATLREAVDALAILKGEHVRDERAPLRTYRLIDGRVCIDEGAEMGDRKAPSPPPGDLDYVGPAQVKPQPPPAPPDVKRLPDPTYVDAEIAANPIWALAFRLSEVDNDNAPIGWSRYIPIARWLLDTFTMEPREDA